MRPKRSLAVAAMCIAIASIFIAPGMASVLVGTVIESASGRVFMNLFGNHTIPLDRVVPAVYEVEALDVIRRELLRHEGIRDLPILVIDPSGMPYGSPRSRGISHGRACQGLYGETGKPTKHIGECYQIVLGSADALDDLLAMMVALPELTRGIRRIEVEDSALFRAARSAKIRPFRNLTLHFDPVWSPDGTRLLYTIWERGRVRFELLDPLSGAGIGLGPLGGYVAARPSWSDDGRFIAYASLQHEVKVFDTRTRTTRTFRPQEVSLETHTLVLWEGTQLHFAFYGGTAGFEVYSYDPARGELQRAAPDAGRPGWVDRAGQWWAFDRRASLSPVRSPTGRYVAIFTFVAGQQRIEVKPLQ